MDRAFLLIGLSSGALKRMRGSNMIADICFRIVEVDTIERRVGISGRLGLGLMGQGTRLLLNIYIGHDYEVNPKFYTSAAKLSRFVRFEQSALLS